MHRNLGGALVQRGTEVVVVDPAVDDAGILIAGLRPGVEVVDLALGRCGLAQIADGLAHQRGIAALHVVCHGEPGALQLAGQRIDLPALTMRLGLLADIAGALSGDACVVLYGCSVAAGPAGGGFVQYLEDALGVEVTASVAPVGAAAQGGSWVFRNADGFPAETVFSPAARAAYPGVLASGDALTRNGVSMSSLRSG